MKKVKLGEVASNETPLYPKGGTVWNLSLDEIESGSGTISKRTTTDVSSLGPSKICFDERYVLYSKLRPYLNKVVLPDEAGVGTSELIPILPNSRELAREYLAIYLRSKHFLNYTGAFVTGANLPRLSTKALWDHEIPLPPLEDQVRTAHLLGKVEGLIAQRKKDIAQLDQLLKSVFLEMFGDPENNEKELSIDPLGKYITHLTSGGRGWAEYYSDSGKRFIRSLDVQMNFIGEDDIAYVNPPDNKETERTRVLTGDVLLTITGSKIGRVCAIPKGFEEAYISQHVAIIRTEGLNPIY